MTLGIAARVRENHELQTLTNTAAYSNAVITARAYDNIAIENRIAGQPLGGDRRQREPDRLRRLGRGRGRRRAERRITMPPAAAAATTRGPRVAARPLAEFHRPAGPRRWNALDEPPGDEDRLTRGDRPPARRDPRGQLERRRRLAAVRRAGPAERRQQIVKLANLPGVKPTADLAATIPPEAQRVSRRKARSQRAPDGMGSPMNAAARACAQPELEWEHAPGGDRHRGNEWVRAGANSPEDGAIPAKVAANNTGGNVIDDVPPGVATPAGRITRPATTRRRPTTSSRGAATTARSTTTIKVGGCTET